MLRKYKLRKIRLISECKSIKKRQLISYKIEFDAFSSGGSGES